MPTVLYRVDERLIHGQVVVGWGGQLRPDRYVVVDEALAGSGWEQELYRLGVPDGVGLEFLSPANAREHLEEWRDSPLRTVVLTRGLPQMLELAQGGTMEGEEVNLGGLHAREGKEEVLSFLFLDEGDRTRLEALAAEGVTISARDLPGSPRTSLAFLLK
jgi:PTS system mannose-specific IIB component/fructoselysine and glucoselysine-specific PTS system IIB component